MRGVLQIIFFPITCISLSAQLTLNEISTPSQIKEGDYQTYLVNRSDDQSGKLYTCRWDFGDNNSMELLNGFNTGHTYMDDGTFTITFSAEDEEGNRNEISKSLQVENVAPEIRYLDGQNTDYANNQASFQSVVYEPGNDQINYKWDFGDGKQKEGRNYADVNHTYDEAGVYTVRLTVEDGDGGRDEESITISVENDWYGSISGDINGNFSGGSSILYQSKIDTITGELATCFKAITLFDDNRNSFFWIFANNLNKLSNSTHSIGNDNDDQFDVILRYDLITSLYENNKTFFRSQEAMDDWTRLSGSSFRSLSLFSDMRRAAATGEDIYGEQYEDISGTITFEPIQGDRLKGSISANLCSRCESENPETPPKYASINLEFDIWINDVAAFQMEHGCEEEANPFVITDYSPREGKANINPENPCIEVSFSEDIDPLSITPRNFRMGYYNVLDEFIIEDFAIDYVEGNRLKIIPQNKLRSGVIYEVFIEDGENGIRSSSGGQLSLDEHWKFSTVIKPSSFKARVYQTVADAPLISGKNTMVRVEVLWNRPIDIGERSFVKDFPTKIKLKSENGRNLSNEFTHVFKQQDLYSEEEIRKALNSARIFDWKPRQSDGNTIIIEIIPDYQECLDGNEAVKFEFTHDISHYDLKPKLRVDCYLFKTADWQDSISDFDLSIVREFIDNNIDLGKQIFPLVDIEANIVETALEIDPGHLDGVNNAQMIDYFKILSLESQADVIVVFTANGEQGGYARSWERNPSLNLPYNRRFVRMNYVPEILPRALLTHEIGHLLSLEHVPYVQDSKDRNYVASQPFAKWEDEIWHRHIEGYRIDLNGRDGFNKNCPEGNEQSIDFCSLMFPTHTNVFYNTVWLDDFQYNKAYEHLKNSKYRLSFQERIGKNYHWASTNVKSPDFDKYKSIIITGILDLEEPKVDISFAKIQDEAANFESKTGYLVVKCFDKNGKELAKRSFDPKPSRTTCFLEDKTSSIAFTTYLDIPAASKPSLIQILEKDKLLGDFKISEASPELNIITPSSGDTINGVFNLDWDGSDTDKDDLFYSIYYTPGNQDDWELIGITRSENLELNTADFSSGLQPSIKIVASDGFNTTEQLIPIHIDFTLQAQWHGLDRFSKSANEIKIRFSNSIVPSSDADKWFKLYEEIDKKKVKSVPYSFRFAPDYRSIILIPHEALLLGSQYFVSYGQKPEKSESTYREESRLKTKEKKSKSAKWSVRNWLGKQVDKLTSDDSNSENGEFLKDILGLPNESKKEEVVVEEEKPKVLLERIIGIQEEEPVIYKIRDVLGNSLDGYYKWDFQTK